MPDEEEQDEEIVLEGEIQEQKMYHPALDITDKGLACITTYMLARQRKGKKVKKIEVPVMVTSDRNYKLIDENDWFYKFVPSNLGRRWRTELLNKFLKGESPEPTFAEVFEVLRKEYNLYMDFPDDRMYDFMALWVMGTYFHQFFETFPYIFWNAMKQSGKSKVLALTEHLAFNSINATSMTPSSMFRLIQGNRCTILLDEAEKSKEHDISEWKSMLNSGYKKAGKVYRTEESSSKNKKSYKVRTYDIFSPKMMANINGVEDVLENRCVYFNLFRTMNVQKGNMEVRESDEKWWGIRDTLYRLLMSQYNEIIDAYNNINILNDILFLLPILSLPEDLSVEYVGCVVTGGHGKMGDVKEFVNCRSDESDENVVNSAVGETTHPSHPTQKLYKLLSNRDMELWRPILVLAKCCSEQLYQTMIEYAIMKSHERQIEEMSNVWDINILYAMMEITTHDDYYFVKEIAERCRMMDGMEEVKNTTIGYSLKRLGFHDKKREGRGIKVAISIDKLKEVCMRYGLEYKAPTGEPEPIPISTTDEGGLVEER